MKKELAEALLAKIMGWTDQEKARERARLESFASYSRLVRSWNGTAYSVLVTDDGFMLGDQRFASPKEIR